MIFCLALAVTAQAQLSEQPTGNSETIVVVLKETTAQDAYRQVANVLQDEGWRLEKSDPVLFTMLTDWQRVKGFFLREMQVDVSIRDGSGGVRVFLRAKMRQDLKNASADAKTMANDGDHMIDTVTKRYNMGKDWKRLESLAGKIGSEFLYQ